MTRIYEYTLKYKEEEPLVFKFINDAVNYMCEKSDYPFTSDVLSDYLTAARRRKRHETVFKNWNITKLPRQPMKSPLVGGCQLVGTTLQVCTF